MKIGEYIKQYRTEHGISMQRFAEMCDLSRAYIYILESGRNPSTGRAPVPTIDTTKKIAEVTGVTLDTLLQMLDSDEAIMVNSEKDPLNIEQLTLHAVAVRALAKLSKTEGNERKNKILEIVCDVLQGNHTIDQLNAISAIVKTMK
jgi:transcriptional regulator with XRE-family HTH domain